MCVCVSASGVCHIRRPIGIMITTLLYNASIGLRQLASTATDYSDEPNQIHTLKSDKIQTDSSFTLLIGLQFACLTILIQNMIF